MTELGHDPIDLPEGASGPMTGRVPKLADVALAAKVSTATVSRCLNEPERVTEDTRKRVLEVIDRLGYSPNFGARALAAKRTNTFGAIIPTMENAIFARGLQAFQDALVANGATMLVASSSYDPTLEVEQIRNLVARGVDGLFLIGKDRDPAIYDFLAQHRVPIVVAWTLTEGGELSSVGFDNALASCELAEHAIGLGHQHIGYISADLIGNDRARERVEGVRTAMQRAGLDPRTLQVVQTVYAVASGDAAFRQLMDQNPRPTLVMCGNDVLAVGALRAAKTLGLSVPGDVSITGFDDIELSTVVEPSLTTVHVPHRTMGTRAAEVLLDQAAGTVAARHIRLGTHVVDRASLGPVPSRSG